MEEAWGTPRRNEADEGIVYAHKYRLVGMEKN